MILVTGASGYVGNNLVRRLVKAGKPVRAMVGHVEKAKLRLSDIDSKVEIVQGDVTKPETLGKAMQGIDTVVHLVAIAIEKGNRTYEAINTQGTINVVDAAIAAGIQHLLKNNHKRGKPDVPPRLLRHKNHTQHYVAPNRFVLGAVANPLGS